MYVARVAAVALVLVAGPALPVAGAASDGPQVLSLRLEPPNGSFTFVDDGFADVYSFSAHARDEPERNVPMSYLDVERIAEDTYQVTIQNVPEDLPLCVVVQGERWEWTPDPAQPTIPTGEPSEPFCAARS